jgi:acetyltransferase-like isoleucine patch superfamily enzyme
MVENMNEKRPSLSERVRNKLASIRRRMIMRILSGGYRYVNSTEYVDLMWDVRKDFYKTTMAFCGDGVQIYPYVVIHGPENVRIGSGSSLNSFIHIWGNGGVTIGDRVMIASHTIITSLTHDYTQVDMTKTYIPKPVTIEDDVWIGSNAIILPGVKIGRGSVIGAGSIVTSDIPPYALAYGIPAKVMKSRPPEVQR